MPVVAGIAEAKAALGAGNELSQVRMTAVKYHVEYVPVEFR